MPHAGTGHSSRDPPSCKDKENAGRYGGPRTIPTATSLACCHLAAAGSLLIPLRWARQPVLGTKTCTEFDESVTTACQHGTRDDAPR